MIELRWVWHDMGSGRPPTGSICIGPESALYQKLQYRYRVPARPTALIDAFTPGEFELSEWIDIPHAGIMV